MGLAAAGALAGTAARTSLIGWLGSIFFKTLWNHKGKAAIAAVAVDKMANDGNLIVNPSLEKGGEILEGGLSKVAKDTFGFDLTKIKEMDISEMLNEFLKFIKENFGNTGSLIAGGATLLTMLGANGGILWKTSIGLGAGIATYAGLKLAFPQMFNSLASDKKHDLTHESTLERTGNEQTIEKSEATEAVALKKGLALNFEETNRIKVEPVTKAKQETTEIGSSPEHDELNHD